MGDGGSRRTHANLKRWKERERIEKEKGDREKATEIHSNINQFKTRF